MMTTRPSALYPFEPGSWKVVLTAVLLLVWCGSLLGLRGLIAGSFAGLFLGFNLLLAAIPLLAGAAFLVSMRRGGRLVPLLWFVVWLLFLPNAPYIVTDLVHLEVRPPVPIWFDIALLFSMAGTGLLFGYASVALVQRGVTVRYGNAVSWACALMSLFLSGFGIYIGRFLRWSSWHVITRPSAVAPDLLRVVTRLPSDSEPAGITLLYGAAVALGYVALRVFAPLFNNGSSSNERPFGQ